MNDRFDNALDIFNSRIAPYGSDNSILWSEVADCYRRTDDLQSCYQALDSAKSKIARQADKSLYKLILSNVKYDSGEYQSAFELLHEFGDELFDNNFEIVNHAGSKNSRNFTVTTQRLMILNQAYRYATYSLLSSRLSSSSFCSFIIG